MKIYDCFMFYNELDVLELRLQETAVFVDKILIVEASKTWVGADKPLIFWENRERFRQYLDKIIHVVVDDLPFDNNTENLEHFQRNCIARGLTDVEDDDIIIISDADEIIRPKVLQDMRQSTQEMFCIMMTMSYFRFNFVCTHGESHAGWAMAMRGRHLRTISPNRLRDLRFKAQAAQRVGVAIEELVKIYPFGGWHFSYMGDETHVRNKIRNCFNTEQYASQDIIDGVLFEQMFQTGRDLYNRPGYEWTVVALNDYFPKTLMENQQKYAQYIAPDPKIQLTMKGWGE